MGYCVISKPSAPLHVFSQAFQQKVITVESERKFKKQTNKKHLFSNNWFPSLQQEELLHMVRTPFDKQLVHCLVAHGFLHGWMGYTVQTLIK